MPILRLTEPLPYVAEVIERAQKDNAFAAKLRRADNPATEDQAYWFLTAKGVDLVEDNIRLPYALIGAAICKVKPQTNGTARIGEALAASFAAREPSGDEKNHNEDKPGSSRLRRLLACDSIRDACVVLRPMLPFIAANSSRPLDYARLLSDLLNLEKSAGAAIRKRWAMEFYGTAGKDEKEEEA